MTKSQIKIGIVGGGNVGKFLSTLLVSAGYDVELVCRDKHRAIRIDNSYAFEIAGDFGHKSYLVPFVSSIKQFSSKKDIIILATKSFDMLNRVPECVQHLTPKGMIVTIQNVYTLYKLTRIIPHEISVCMVCDFACATSNKVTYVKNSKGITLGVYHKAAVNRMKLFKRIMSKFMEVDTTNDIVGFTMGRNIINSTIAVLGAISGLRLKDILTDRNGRYLFCKIINEAYNICRRFRINVIPYNYKLNYGKFVEKSISGWLYRRRILRLLIRQNGNVRSSALKELESGEKTEIRALLDCMIQYGKKAKSSIDYISALREMIIEIENGKRNISEDALYDKSLVNIDKKGSKL